MSAEDKKFIGYMSVSIVLSFVLIISIMTIFCSCSKITVEEEKNIVEAVEEVADVAVEVELGFNPHLENITEEKP